MVETLKFVKKFSNLSFVGSAFEYKILQVKLEQLS